MGQKTNDSQELQKDLNKSEKKVRRWGVISVASGFVMMFPGFNLCQTSSRIDNAAFTLLCCLMTAGLVKFIDATAERDKIYNKLVQQQYSNQLYRH